MDEETEDYYETDDDRLLRAGKLNDLPKYLKREFSEERKIWNIIENSSREEFQIPTDSRAGAQSLKTTLNYCRTFLKEIDYCTKVFREQRKLLGTWVISVIEVDNTWKVRIRKRKEYKVEEL